MRVRLDLAKKDGPLPVISDRPPTGQGNEGNFALEME